MPTATRHRAETLSRSRPGCYATRGHASAGLHASPAGWPRLLVPVSLGSMRLRRVPERLGPMPKPAVCGRARVAGTDMPK